MHEVGVLSVADLARELGVSNMTVRRDLHRMETAGQVRTVHGGVGLAVGGHDGGRPQTAQGPRRVARCAAGMVRTGDTVALDAGPAAFELARALPSDFTGSVITHSMPVMHLLAERVTGGRPRLVALGGELAGSRQALVGPTTLEAIAGLRARTFFLDAAAVDVRGAYACSTAEARVARGLADIADEVVLLATREAFAASAPALVAGLHRLTAAVTDGPPPVALAAAFERAGVVVNAAGLSRSGGPAVRRPSGRRLHARIRSGSGAPVGSCVRSSDCPSRSTGAASRRRHRAAVSSVGIVRSTASATGPLMSASIAATSLPCTSNTGTATALAAPWCSPWATATPRARIRWSARSSSPGWTRVLAV